LSPGFDGCDHHNAIYSSTIMAKEKDKPLLSSDESSQDKNGTADSVPARKPTLADYFRVFSYATKWDFCIYAVACFASIAGGATMPLSKHLSLHLISFFSSSFSFSFSRAYSLQIWPISPHTYTPLLARSFNS
jgi:hypothetical protein